MVSFNLVFFCLSKFNKGASFIRSWVSWLFTVSTSESCAVIVRFNRAGTGPVRLGALHTAIVKLTIFTGMPQSLTIFALEYAWFFHILPAHSLVCYHTDFEEVARFAVV